MFMGGIALGLGYLFLKFSLYLAATRIYQVDECESVFVARILADGQAANYSSSVTLLHWPLIWLAQGATRSTELFASARCFMLLVFWLNILLLALATGERLLSRRFLIALAGAATLAPLWDYGFEIRHDNLLLTGLLLFWCAVRQVPAKMSSCIIAGAITITLEFVAFKAFVYTIPLSFLALFFPRSGSVSRWKLVFAWMAGALGMFLILRVAYGMADLWPLFSSDIESLFLYSVGNNHRFPPWATLERLLTQTPLLMAMLLAGLITVVTDLIRRRKMALTWDGWLPETFLLAIAFAALMINPTPFAYNLLNLVPFIFLFVFRYAALFLKDAWASPVWCPLLISVFIFNHLVPFGIVTRRHLNWTNQRQEQLMRLAEDLTDPVKDHVYDGIGLVPTRTSINFHWFLHSFIAQNFKSGTWPTVSEMLAARPASVIIPSYRTDWLPAADHEFITNRYVSVADDFWVLGKVLPESGGEFQIYQPGRYRIATLAGSDLVGTYPGGVQGAMQPSIKGEVAGTLDGAALTNQQVTLTVGAHRIACATNCQPTIVWLGPKLDRIGRQGDSSHQRLFVNWY